MPRPPPPATSARTWPPRPDRLRPPVYAPGVNRNLITRMGTASGVVAALVAAVFAVLVTAVRDQRSSTDAARQSQQVITAARDVEFGLATHTDTSAAVQRLRALVTKNPQQAQRVATIVAAADDVPRQQLIARLVATEQEKADARRRDADHKASQAISLGIGGLIGSALLIALLTTYLTRYIVVPVRRTARAARRLAGGALRGRDGRRSRTRGGAGRPAARCRGGGRSPGEPIELARAFNMMADSLQE